MKAGKGGRGRGKHTSQQEAEGDMHTKGKSKEGTHES